MRIVIISDIHGNAESLSTLPDQYDELWVLGDLVNYGPEPGVVVDFVRSHAAVVVRGNHDDAVGFNRDPRCSPPYRQMAKETMDYTRSVLSQVTNASKLSRLRCTQTSGSPRYTNQFGRIRSQEDHRSKPPGLRPRTCFANTVSEAHLFQLPVLLFERKQIPQIVVIVRIQRYTMEPLEQTTAPSKQVVAGSGPAAPTRPTCKRSSQTE
jgi:Calcineurin-like phosphoesterase